MDSYSSGKWIEYEVLGMRNFIVLCLSWGKFCYCIRFIFWMHKYGMPYFLLLLVGFKEPSAIWVRLVVILFSYNDILAIIWCTMIPFIQHYFDCYRIFGMLVHIWKYAVDKLWFSSCTTLVTFYFQIRTLGMLRSRFESVPSAFSRHLVPSHEDAPRKPLVINSNEFCCSSLFVCTGSLVFFYWCSILDAFCAKYKSSNIILFSSLFYIAINWNPLLFVLSKSTILVILGWGIRKKKCCKFFTCVEWVHIFFENGRFDQQSVEALLAIQFITTSSASYF
jgi:hypothetical protein